MADSGGSSYTSYGTIAAIQIAVVVVLMVIGGWMSLKSKDLSDSFILKVAQTVVIFLPLALAWFGIFSALFLQNLNLLLPVLVGVSAVGFNLIIDFAFKKFIVDKGIGSTYL
jgi:hypothetical protein